MNKRPIHKTLLKRLREPRRFIQVLAGPRQVGKTVLARQVMGTGVRHAKLHNLIFAQPLNKEGTGGLVSPNPRITAEG